MQPGGLEWCQKEFTKIVSGDAADTGELKRVRELLRKPSSHAKLSAEALPEVAKLVYALANRVLVPGPQNVTALKHCIRLLEVLPVSARPLTAKVAVHSCLQTLHHPGHGRCLRRVLSSARQE